MKLDVIQAALFFSGSALQLWLQWQQHAGGSGASVGRLSVTGVRTLIRFEGFVITAAALPGSELINIFYRRCRRDKAHFCRLASDQHK